MAHQPGIQQLALINQHLLNHLSLDATELVGLHPPQFQDRNKQLVYNLICPNGAASHHGRLEYTRWKQLELPITILGSLNGSRRPTVVEGFFNYPPPPTDARESHWHVNFADK